MSALASPTSVVPQGHAHAHHHVPETHAEPQPGLCVVCKLKPVFIDPSSGPTLYCSRHCRDVASQSAQPQAQPHAQHHHPHAQHQHQQALPAYPPQQSSAVVQSQLPALPPGLPDLPPPVAVAAVVAGAQFQHPAAPAQAGLPYAPAPVPMQMQAPGAASIRMFCC